VIPGIISSHSWSPIISIGISTMYQSEICRIPCCSCVPSCSITVICRSSWCIHSSYLRSIAPAWTHTTTRNRSGIKTTMRNIILKKHYFIRWSRNRWFRWIKRSHHFSIIKIISSNTIGCVIINSICLIVSRNSFLIHFDSYVQKMSILHHP